MTADVHRLIPILRQADCGHWLILDLFRRNIVLDHPRDDNGVVQPRERPVEVARG